MHSLAMATTAAAFDPLRDFRAFTLMHAIALIAMTIGAAIIISIGLRHRGAPQQAGYERSLGIVGIIIWLLANGYGLLPSVRTVNVHWLPLHVCDICALAGPIVLLCRAPPMWLRAMVYFWGLGLCTQAFATPTLREGPVNPQFWWFWLGHFVIVVSALYELIVRRWRPTWRAFRIAIALNAMYVAIVLPIDIVGGWNYGFIGREMKAGTMIEWLGPWPWRVGVIFVLSGLAFVALMLPWTKRTPAVSE